MIRLSIVILSWNTQDLLRSCLRSILEGPRSLPYEIVVVDNGSEDGSPEMVKQEFPEVRLVCLEKNIGYAAGNNVGMREAVGDYVLLLNSDTEVVGSAPETMVAFLDDHREYGGATCRLLNPDGSIQPGCKRFPTRMVALFWETIWERAWAKFFGPSRVIRHYMMTDFDHQDSRDVDQPPGACFMMPRRVIDKVGGFDESLWLFFNDVDLCRRVQYAGFAIRYLNHEVVIHHEGASTRKFGRFIYQWNLNRMRYYHKHYGKSGAYLISAMTWLLALEERIKILWNYRGEQRREAFEAVSEILRDMKKERSHRPNETQKV